MPEEILSMKIGEDHETASLDLRNGDTYSLAPGNQPNHFKDQKGNKVVRTTTGGSEVFKWEGGTKITVTFVSTPSTSSARRTTPGPPPSPAV